ncbi:MAG: HEAT repeat domain-containing protein [Gemmatimonadetes bacterium]|nr:HEAT repeat domain-containing protein [Gemmatimonadota bacterium]
MSESGKKKELGGYARSIDALFSAGSAESTSVPDDAIQAGGQAVVEIAAVHSDTVLDPFVEIPEQNATAGGDPLATDVTWEVVPDSVERAASGVDADPDALSAALDRFLASDPLERDGQAHEIREMVAALRAVNALDPLADAVERLVIEAHDDEASLALADLMLTAGVASRIAARLGAERDEERRAQLLKVCKAVGVEMAVAIADALSDTYERFARRAFMDAMVMLGNTAMVVVEQMIDDKRWFVVRNAVAILGEVGGDRAVELITSTLAHTNGRVRREALLALAKIGGEDAGQLVYGMLEDPDPEARLAAVMAAGALKVERALRPLLGILESESDSTVRVGILQALGKLGDPGAVNSIEKYAVGSFFSKPPTDTRIAAYRALFHIGTPHAKRLLGQAVDDKSPEVKAAVRDMLGMR